MLSELNEESEIAQIIGHLRQNTLDEISFFARTQLRNFLREIRDHATQSGFPLDGIDYDLIDLRLNYMENKKRLLDAGYPVTGPSVSHDEREIQEQASEYMKDQRSLENWRKTRPTSREILEATGGKVIVTKNRRRGTIRIRVHHAFLGVIS